MHVSQTEQKLQQIRLHIKKSVKNVCVKDCLFLHHSFPSLELKVTNLHDNAPVHKVKLIKMWFPQVCKLRPSHLTLIHTGREGYYCMYKAAQRLNG